MAQHYLTSVSWQQGETDLGHYISWVARCRLLITSDSLGLHLALALGRPTVALFGPTLASELEDRDTLIKLTPGRACAPCTGEACLHGTACVATIPPQRVAQAALELLCRARVAA